MYVFDLWMLDFVVQIPFVYFPKSFLQFIHLLSISSSSCLPLVLFLHPPPVLHHIVLNFSHLNKM